jgi:hypothetical protein
MTRCCGVVWCVRMQVLQLGDLGRGIHPMGILNCDGRVLVSPSDRPTRNVRQAD